MPFRHWESTFVHSRFVGTSLTEANEGGPVFLWYVMDQQIQFLLVEWPRDKNIFLRDPQDFEEFVVFDAVI